MNQILVVDDDEDLLALLKKFLERHHYVVDTVTSGAQMDVRMRTTAFDVVILDIMLPGEDGLSLCRRLRTTSRVPVILLTAMTDITDRIVGLELGADDYLAKPFDARELLARIRALLRRSTVYGELLTGHNAVLQFGTWQLNVAKRELRSEDATQVPLSNGEFELLLVFLEHPQRLLTREQLIDYAHGSTHEVFDRSIDVKISRIRRKIETNVRSPEVIRTVRNSGYIFTLPVRSIG
ncbi:response regulator [Dyella sp. A6]|uniref:response regulator n=1 Tax=Dyella aluminiiresistens TaxID=3069105 RepID=UPI002E780C4A|nr:response regulator [Dyella sp. A6]